MNLVIAEDRSWDKSVEVGSWEDSMLITEFDVSLSSIKEIEELIKNNMFCEFVQDDWCSKNVLTYKESFLTILRMQESEDDLMVESNDLTYVIVVENKSVQ